jgi:uncharacterized membrane protein
VETPDLIYRNTARTLQIGFRLAAGLLLCGIAIAIIRSQPLATSTGSLGELPGELARFDSQGFIDLAIITIVLTPLAAVIVIWRGFKRAGELRYAAYSLGVVAVLLCSIALSLIR